MSTDEGDLSVVGGEPYPYDWPFTCRCKTDGSGGNSFAEVDKTVAPPSHWCRYKAFFFLRTIESTLNHQQQLSHHERAELSKWIETTLTCIRAFHSSQFAPPTPPPVPPSAPLIDPSDLFVQRSGYLLNALDEIEASRPGRGPEPYLNFYTALASARTLHDVNLSLARQLIPRRVLYTAQQWDQEVKALSPQERAERWSRIRSPRYWGQEVTQLAEHRKRQFGL